MKIKELENKIVEKINEEKIEEITEILMEKIKNVKACKKTLKELEKDLDEFKNLDIDDFEYDEFEY